MWVAAGGPERLRLDLVGRLGGTWLSLAVAGGVLTALSPRTGEHLRAPQRPGLLESVTGWPLEAEQAADLLLGCPPARSGSLRVRYDGWRREGGAQVPGRIVLERGGEGGGTLRLRLEWLRPGPVDGALFALEPPPGSRPLQAPPAGGGAPLWEPAGEAP
jgi:hypothetical protein